MDKAKILRLCKEIEDSVTELAECCEIIDLHTHTMLIDKLRGIGAEISAKPKSNGDRIRQMSDEELAEMLDIYDVDEICCYCSYRGQTCHNKCYYGIIEWLKQEVQSNDGTD